MGIKTYKPVVRILAYSLVAGGLMYLATLFFPRRYMSYQTLYFPLSQQSSLGSVLSAAGAGPDSSLPSSLGGAFSIPIVASGAQAATGIVTSRTADMLNVEGIVLEPAGALSVDVLPDLADVIRGRRIVCVTSGGNFDFERLPEVKERAQRYAGLKKYFILRMPQRPGALREFLAMLGPDDDIARFEYLKKSARNFGSVLIGIETKSADSFAALIRKMDEAAFSYRDITDDDALAEFLV